jgi:hypothetical protein
MHWKGCGRKWFWPNLRYSSGIFLEEQKKNTNSTNHDSQCLGQDEFLKPPEYKSKALLLEPSCAVSKYPGDKLWSSSLCFYPSFYLPTHTDMLELPASTSFMLTVVTVIQLNVPIPVAVIILDYLWEEIIWILSCINWLGINILGVFFPGTWRRPVLIGTLQCSFVKASEVCSNFSLLMYVVLLNSLLHRSLKKTPWLWSASELCRPSDHRLLAK